MISLLINLLIVLLVAGVIFWVVRLIVPAFGLPAVIVQVAGVIIALVVIIYLLQLLLGGGFSLPLRDVD